MCQSKKSEELCKRNRTIITPTRTRPFIILSPDEKIEAYQHCHRKIKYTTKKYGRLVSKLATSKACLNIREKSSAPDLLKRHVSIYLKIGIFQE